jgi:CRP/FNR family transcriptional regulator
MVAPEVLAGVSFFGELDQDVLRFLATKMVPMDAIAEQIIFLQNETSAGLYFVETGWLKGTKMTASGREQVLRYFGPGETVNEVSLFLDNANPATLIALEDSRLWLIPRETVLELMESNPEVMRAITRNLAKRLLYLVNLVEDLSLLPLEARQHRANLKDYNLSSRFSLRR